MNDPKTPREGDNIELMSDGILLQGGCKNPKRLIKKDRFIAAYIALT